MNLLGYLPAETLLSAEIDDVGVLLENLEEGPLGELWNSKAVKKLRDRFVSEATAGDEMEEEIKELLERLKKWSEKLSGQTVIAYETPLDLLKLRKDKADLDEDGDEVPDGPNISGLQILAEFCAPPRKTCFCAVRQAPKPTHF